MKRLAAMVCGLGCALVTSTASAEERPTISTEVRSGWAWLGGKRATGGLTLGGGARYLQPIDGGPWGVYGGLAASAVGVGDSWLWMGLLAAPEVGAWWASGSWHVSAGAALQSGQIPTCTDWGLCLRSWGFYPEGAARVALRSESVRIGLEASGMYVSTLPWTGIGWQLRIVGAYR